MSGVGQPEPDDASAQPDDQPQVQPGQTPTPGPRRLPKVDPEAIETRHYMSAGGATGDSQLAVTASGGEVLDTGAPTGLFSHLVDVVGNAVQGVGHLLVPPVVSRAESTASITIFLTDPVDVAEQLEFPYYATARAGQEIGRLMRLNEQELFEAAVRLGSGAEAYVDLMNFVGSAGIDLEWESLGTDPVKITTIQAEHQFGVLAAPPTMRRREMTIEGLLYRVIYEGKGTGRVGIKLSKHSPLPPRRHGRTVIVRYERPEIEDQVIHHLIGQPVRAHILFEEPVPLTSIVSVVGEHPEILQIQSGPSFEPMVLEDGDVDEDPYF